MSDSITITIQIKDGRASLLAIQGKQGIIGDVSDYQQPDDLLPEITRLIGALPELALPDIKTTKKDKVVFYGGYKDWQADDTAWGFNAPDYKPPVARSAKRSASRKSSKVKHKPVAPFTLEQNGSQRTLLMTDDFDISLEFKDNKKLKFNKLDDAKRVAAVLATQDGATITIKDKKGKSVETVKAVKQKSVKQA